jgi:hypothetical protein
MSSRYGRIAGALAAVLAAGLAGYSLRPVRTAATVPARQPTEIRTQVIRRTVHVVRHSRPPHGPASSPPGTRPAAPYASSGARAVATRASAHRTGGGAPSVPAGTAVVTTRTSASRSAPAGSVVGGSGSAAAPVTTRTSAGHSVAGSTGGSRPVTTRSSSHGGGPGPVTTRNSGGGGERGDGGDGGGD